MRRRAVLCAAVYNKRHVPWPQLWVAHALLYVGKSGVSGIDKCQHSKHTWQCGRPQQRMAGSAYSSAAASAAREQQHQQLLCGVAWHGVCRDRQW
jgi:hypothetical protein